nr:RagB/SusD family nutrient uptake outer membrane protein [uncultured Flavobacterium sp.]
MKKINLIVSLFSLVTLLSCTKDLDVISTDSTVKTPEVLFSTPEGYKQALAGVYGNLSLTGTGDAGSSFLEGIDAGTSQFGRCLWYLQELTTDEVVWSYENDEGTAELNRNIWGASNPILLGFYSRTMAEVAIANDFLRQSAPEKLAARGITASADVANINDYRNEVRVLRAYAYYNLMDLFGKAPFYDENSAVNSQGPEYNREQLFTFIETELNAVLPDLKAARANEYGRVDQGVANMILAKIYLNAEVYIGTPKYAECMEKCTTVITSGYTLNTNYLNNFNADNNTSPEIIFALQSDGRVTQNYGATTVIINGQVGSIEKNGVDFGVGGWGGALRLRKQFVQKFDGSDYTNDVRNTIIGDSRSIDITNITTNDQGFVLAKWSNVTSNGVAGSNSNFVDTDFPVFRLADAYLMYAEAQMRKDGAVNGSVIENANSTSLGYINDLRTRANGVAVTSANLDFILDERARELHWEAFRRQDLIRFGKYTTGYNWAWKGNSLNGTSISNNMKLFPIPANSLKANPNLTQNNGY